MNNRLTIELDAPVMDWLADMAAQIGQEAGQDVPPAVVAAGILQGAYAEQAAQMDFGNKDDG